MDTAFYFNHLYPFQGRVLDGVNKLETEFYLTGGTAASRGYLRHRVSDDLDLFVNDDSRFSLWAERILLCQVSRTEWELVRWIDAPPYEHFQSDLIQLGESLLLLR